MTVGGPLKGGGGCKGAATAAGMAGSSQKGRSTSAPPSRPRSEDGRCGWAGPTHSYPSE